MRLIEQEIATQPDCWRASERLAHTADVLAEARQSTFVGQGWAAAIAHEAAGGGVAKTQATEASTLIGPCRSSNAGYDSAQSCTDSRAFKVGAAVLGWQLVGVEAFGSGARQPARLV
jgi:hypothetical protein